MTAMFTKKHPSLFVVVLFICIISTLKVDVCQAQEEINKIPELNGHVFVPTDFLLDPFNNTYMEINVGIGSTGQFKYPLFEIGGDPIYATRGQLLFASFELDYQQKIQDWVSLHIKYSLAARLGTNIGTILAQGFSTINTFKIGWKIRILERQKTMLSGTFGVANYSGTFLSVSQFVEDVIDDNPSPTLVTNVPALNGNFGFQFAYGINQLWGLKFNFINTVGESLQEDKLAYMFALGANADVNFYQKYSVPIGLSLGYELSSQPEQVFRESGLSNSIYFKIAYTGTPDFIIGLDLGYLFIPVSEVQGNLNIVGVGFGLTYYFN